MPNECYRLICGPRSDWLLPLMSSSSRRGLPKTRYGKILLKITEGKFDKLGGTSTLADPSVVDDLIEGRKLSGD